MKTTVLALTLLASVTGCKSPAATAGTGDSAPVAATTVAAAAPSPATLSSISAECKAQLAKSVATSLGVQVPLANDALVKTSTLLIERKRANSPDGQRLSGKDFDLPEKFVLTSDQKSCTLKHERTGKEFNLDRCGCIIIKTSP